jgi:hypothetical protein
MSEEIKKSVEKPIRLTKRGLPDKRAESSKKNLEKGKSIIKQALQQVKQKKVDNPVLYSSDEYSTDEEEIILTEQLNKAIPQQTKTAEAKIVPINQPVSEEHYTFTFEKKLEEKIKELNDMYGIKISNIENETKLTKAELNALKLQNQVLKKTMTNNFRTQAGVINEEMYLKF